MSNEFDHEMEHATVARRLGYRVTFRIDETYYGRGAYQYQLFVIMDPAPTREHDIMITSAPKKLSFSDRKQLEDLR